MRNKANYCQGWADWYMRRANESRQRASDPAMTEVDAEGYRLHAKQMEIIAGKYQHVADHPWRRYPRHPLITADEKANAAKRH